MSSSRSRVDDGVGPYPMGSPPWGPSHHHPHIIEKTSSYLEHAMLWTFLAHSRHSFDTPLRLFWGSLDILLTLFWNSFESLSKLFWGSFEPLWGLFWNSFEAILKLCWVHLLSNDVWTPSRISRDDLETIVKRIRNCFVQFLMNVWPKLESNPSSDWL